MAWAVVESLSDGVLRHDGYDAVKSGLEFLRPIGKDTRLEVEKERIETLPLNGANPGNQTIEANASGTELYLAGGTSADTGSGRTVWRVNVADASVVEVGQVTGVHSSGIIRGSARIGSRWYWLEGSSGEMWYTSELTGDASGVRVGTIGDTIEAQTGMSAGPNDRLWVTRKIGNEGGVRFDEYSVGTTTGTLLRLNRYEGVVATGNLGQSVAIDADGGAWLTGSGTDLLWYVNPRAPSEGLEDPNSRFGAYLLESELPGGLAMFPRGLGLSADGRTLWMVNNTAGGITQVWRIPIRHATTHLLSGNERVSLGRNSVVVGKSGGGWQAVGPSNLTAGQGLVWNGEEVVFRGVGASQTGVMRMTLAIGGS